MNNVRTVSDTKRAFYALHTRPIHSIYRRVVEELMVEMHLLQTNVDFQYDPIYALGVVSTFNQFMQKYRPEADRDSIFSGLCRSLESNPQHYLDDASQLEALATRHSVKDLVEQLTKPETTTESKLREPLQQIIGNPQFKYSRLFAIGLFNLLQTSDPESTKDEKQRVEFLNQICLALHLPEEKLQKDLDLYRSNLEKMAQAQAVMEDMLEADRKQRDQREQAKDAVADPVSDVPVSDPKDEAPSSNSP